MAFRRAARWTAAGSLGVGALAGAQAFACHAWYESLPDATGPTRGVAIPRTVVHAVAEGREGGAVGQSAKRWAAMWDTGRGGDARPMSSLLGEVACLSSSRSDDEEDRSSRSSRSSHASRSNRGVHETRETRRHDRDAGVVRHGSKTDGADASASDDDDGDRRLGGCRRNHDDLLVYVLGDSLVTGVGASRAARGFGPVLPRAFAERLADVTGRRVVWRAFGKKAADVGAIRREVVPAARRAFRDETFSTKKRDAAAAPDVVLILCGVNDFKHAFSGRTPEAFRRELRAAVRDARAAFADSCDENEDWIPDEERADDGARLAARVPVVVLPGMPMQLVTAFPPPLSLAAVAAGDTWDAQKRKVAAEDSRGRKRSATGRTVFVTKPSAEFMGAVFGAGARLTAEDGVHPNEWGYAAWAHHIASEVAEVLAARAETRKPGPERFVSREGEGTEWAPS